MDKETFDKLEKVLVERMRIQVENPDDDASKYTHEELVSFALEEAWQNGELAFLTADIDAIKDCAECHYQPCKVHDK